jgi:hypothetical protein
MLALPPDAVASDSLSVLLHNSFWVWTFSPVLATYQDMVNSGDLRLLRSDELRLVLSEFDEQVEHVDRLDQTLWEHWLRFDLPFLQEHYVLSELYEGYRSGADIRGVEVEPILYGTPDFSPDHEAIRSRTFHNIVVARTVAHQDAIVAMKVALQQIDRVLFLVDAELRGRFAQ